MTEEDGFLRAIAQAPGDDAPRLVYADWLDDDGDLRGAYLRVEAEWAKSRTAAGAKNLRAHAKLLDPVWVARVSRPPVGVCADQVRIWSPGPELTPDDLDRAERRLKVTFPTEYRAFLLNWNGGYPSLGRFRYNRGGTGELEWFMSVYPKGKRRDDRDWLGDVVESTETLWEPMARLLGHVAACYIPIGSAGDDDCLLLGICRPRLRRVMYFNWTDRGRLYPVARSLAAFLKKLADAEREWARLIRNKETKQFLAWLDAGGDVNVRHKQTGETPVSLATALVRELLARGAKVTRQVRELAEISGYPRVKRALEGGRTR